VVSAQQAETAILQEIDATHRKTALADFRWQSIDFVDALNAEGGEILGVLFFRGGSYTAVR
jgi:hypothetical protein